ncbi:hypothetical protein ACFL35_20030 [Candidatus Riflebacteria bacterium]
MDVYLDTSILLRVLFAEPDPLKEFKKITHAVSSEILKLEGMRTIDRYRIVNSLSEDEYL